MSQCTAMVAGADDLRCLRTDLHVHTVASPCAEIEMIPPLIVEQAQRLGLAVMAITDHHTIDNVEAVIQAANGSGITVLPGMEVQTREEVHLLCLFDDLVAAYCWQMQVYDALPDLPNDARAFGIQLAVDCCGEMVRVNERLLLTSTRLSVEQVSNEVHSLGGLVIAAHVDRPAYSLLSNLGFIPDELDLDAIEVSALSSPDTARSRWPDLQERPLVRWGDAHRLTDMRRDTVFAVEKPTIAEMHLAFAGLEGRKVCVVPPETVTEC